MGTEGINFGLKIGTYLAHTDDFVNRLLVFVSALLHGLFGCAVMPVRVCPKWRHDQTMTPLIGVHFRK